MASLAKIPSSSSASLTQSREEITLVSKAKTRDLEQANHEDDDISIDDKYDLLRNKTGPFSISFEKHWMDLIGTALSFTWETSTLVTHERVGYRLLQRQHSLFLPLLVAEGPKTKKK